MLIYLNGGRVELALVLRFDLADGIIQIVNIGIQADYSCVQCLFFGL
jgi:hypothetical protein